MYRVSGLKNESANKFILSPDYGLENSCENGHKATFSGSFRLPLNRPDPQETHRKPTGEPLKTTIYVVYC